MLLWDTWRGGVPTYPLCSFPVCGGSPGSYLPPRFVHSVTIIDKKTNLEASGDENVTSAAELLVTCATVVREC